MTSTTRQLLTGLAAVAFVLIVGGVAFDRHETRAYSQCMDTMRVLRDAPQPPVDPHVVVSVSLLQPCEDANRVGFAVAGVGAVLLAVAVIVWWARQRAAEPGWQ